MPTPRATAVAETCGPGKRATNALPTSTRCWVVVPASSAIEGFRIANRDVVTLTARIEREELTASFPTALACASTSGITQRSAPSVPATTMKAITVTGAPLVTRSTLPAIARVTSAMTPTATR